jgi:hypothetical protein
MFIFLSDEVHINLLYSENKKLKASAVSMPTVQKRSDLLIRYHEGFPKNVSSRVLYSYAILVHVIAVFVRDQPLRLCMLCPVFMIALKPFPAFNKNVLSGGAWRIWSTN